MTATPAVEMQVSIPLRRVAFLLHSAYQGCAYWAQIAGYEEPPVVRAVLHEPTPAVDYPLTGGAVLISNAPAEFPRGNVRIVRLDLAAIERGLRRLYDTHPRHYCAFVTGNEDAITGDVFLQLCLYGWVVYG